MYKIALGTLTVYMRRRNFRRFKFPLKYEMRCDSTSSQIPKRKFSCLVHDPVPFVSKGLLCPVPTRPYAHDHAPEHNQIDQRRVDVSTGISKVSCNDMCVSVRLSVCRSVCRRDFYLGVQRFCSETLSSSAFSAYPACIHKLHSQNGHVVANS